MVNMCKFIITIFYFNCIQNFKNVLNVVVLVCSQ